MSAPTSDVQNAARAAASSRPPPFPLMKVAVIAAINFCNSASFLATFPFVAFQILSFYPGLTESEVGFYSGILEGSYHFGACIGAVVWGVLADRFGRRPCLLLGLAGTIASAVMFGLAKTFAFAIFARTAWGFLNGNVGIVKTSLSELVDDRHTPRAFSYIGLATGFARIAGPGVGGLLSNPAVKYPSVFAGTLFDEGRFPFLLPCLVASAWTAVILLAAWASLEETLPIQLRKSGGAYASVPSAEEEEAAGGPADAEEGMRNNAIASASFVAIVANESDEQRESSEEAGEDDKHVVRLSTNASLSSARAASAVTAVRATAAATTPSATAAAVAVSKPPKCVAQGPIAAATPESLHATFRRLALDRAVASATSLYTLLGLFGLCSNEIFPLWVITPPSVGGFEFASKDIGIIVMLAGGPLMLFQFACYHKLADWLGLMILLRLSLAGFAILMATTPLVSLTLLLSREAQFVLMSLHYTLTTIVRVTAFTCTFVVVANSALPQDRGKVNGIGQAAVSVGRMLAPPLFTALYAWSISSTAHVWPFDFSLCWLLMGLGGALTLWTTYLLPEWIERKRVECDR